MQHPCSKPTIIAALCAALLAACGGGGDNASPAASPAPSTPGQSISGKAIDGYLIGATVCLDLNANNNCDSGEPSTTSGANGDFSIPYDGDIIGKRLLVQVTQATRDLSRPAGFSFPASYALSAILGGSSVQHVTPLTSMVAAQMESGKSQAEAIAAVQALLGNAVDPSANYVANGDAATASMASLLVDKITALAATGGKADAATVRNVLNAIIAKGDIASVTQADVDAQAAKPVYDLADASKALASPLYSFVDSSWVNLAEPTQAIQQITGGALQTRYQVRKKDTTTWQDLQPEQTSSFMEPTAQFAMKADGSWTDMLVPAQWHAPQPLSSIGPTLAGTDPLTGIGFTYEERRVDLSNQPAKVAVNGTLFGPDVSVYPALSGSVLPAGTQGYLGIQTYNADRVVLPLGLGSGAGCEFPYQATGTCPDNGSTPYDPKVPKNDSTLPSPLTSVQQLVGRTLVEPVIAQVRIQISADGTATMTQLNGNTPSPPMAAKWSIYQRNPNVMVFDVSREIAASLASHGAITWPLVQGARLVLAVRSGQLHSGVLFPAGYGQRTIQFANGLPSVLTTAVPLPSLP